MEPELFYVKINYSLKIEVKKACARLIVNPSARLTA
jgi:hypothetical protein